MTASLLRHARSPFPPPRRARRGAGGAALGHRRRMMPDGGAEARAEQLATLKLIRHEHSDRSALPDLLRRRRGAERSRSAGSAPICARCAAPGCMRRRCRPISSKRPRTPIPLARCSGARRGRRTISPRVLPALQKVLDLEREVAAAKAAKLGVSALRGAARPIRARRQQRRDRPRLRRPLPHVLPGLIDEAIARQARRAGAARAAGPVPDRDAARGRREADGSDRLRFRPRPARCQPASVLRRHAGRRAHHHALRGRGFPPRADGRPARDRPRDV